MLKKIKIGSAVFLVAWIIFAQSCMFFRTSDIESGKAFTAKGIALQVFYEKINGYTMHYVKVGADTMPTLVLIHGSPGSWDAFKDYLQDVELQKKFRLIAIDRPGFGYSEFGKALNLQDQSSLISVLLKSWRNNKPIYLAGHSLGGPLVVSLAIDNPGQINGLVLLSAAIDPGQEKPEKWRKILMNNPLQYMVPGAMRPSNYELWYLKDDLKILEQDISKLQVPVYMIHGTKDPMVPFANVAFAKAHIPDSLLHLTPLEGANHFIPWTRFDTIKKIFLSLPSNF